MAKKEIITIKEEYQYPKASKVKMPKEKLYKETTIVRVRDASLDKTMSLEGQMKQVEKDISIIEMKIDSLYREYLFLKLFHLSAKYSEKFIKDFSTFDHYINKIRNDLLNIKRYFNGLRGQMDVTGHAIDEVYNEVNNFYDYIVGLYSDISDLRKIHYHEFKVTSHALVKDKTIDEYENLIYRVEEELSKYKNIEEAYDYIVYNSGNEIMELVEEFLKINSKQTSRLTYHYFLQTDAVIAFKHHEWVDLFVKFNYVMNKLKDVTYSKQFCTKFQNLETKYAIITIYCEINR